jgi:hypothetical protein
MLGKVEKVFIVLICASLLVLAVSVGATEYSPGVQVGYSVRYENFVVQDPSDSGSIFNATKWMKMEVIGVIGNRVTVHTSRTLKNDTFEDGSDYVFDVATSEMDRSGSAADLWNNYLVVAGNLTEGSDTHLGVMLPKGSVAMFINRTETKDLLGTNRTVNLVDYYESSKLTFDYSYEFHAVYDQATGMLLNLNYSLTYPSIPIGNEVLSYSAAEINTTPQSSDNTLTYAGVTIAIVIIVVIAATLVVRRRRKAQTVESVHKVAKKTARR